MLVFSIQGAEQIQAFTPSATMPTIEVGGRKRGCRPTRLPPDTPCVDATRLQNPFGAIKRHELDESIESITDWLRAKNAKRFDALVDTAMAHLLRGDSVRIVCLGGKHRSQAVGRAVFNRITGQSEFEYDVLESQLPQRSV